MLLACLSLHVFDAHFKFPSGVELAQTFDSLLAVHHGGHSGALLHVCEGKKQQIQRTLMQHRVNDDREAPTPL